MGQMGRALLCLLLLVAVVLAGCSGTTESDSSTTSKSGTGSKSSSGTKASGTGSQTGAPTSGGGGGGGTGDNNPPTGAISASIPSGAVPLTVKFDLKGTDQDGDDLSWNLDLDGDGKTDKTGEALPATESYNYTVAGSYNVSFAISDGTDTVTYKVTINATGEGGGAAGPLQIVDGGFSSGAGAGCSPVGGYFGNLSGVFDHQSFEPNPATIGRPFTVAFTQTGSAVSYVVQFWNGGNSVTEDNQSPTSPVTGVVPSPTDQVIISACGPGAQFTFHYEA